MMRRFDPIKTIRMSSDIRPWKKTNNCCSITCMCMCVFLLAQIQDQHVDENIRMLSVHRVQPESEIVVYAYNTNIYGSFLNYKLIHRWKHICVCIPYFNSSLPHRYINCSCRCGYIYEYKYKLTLQGKMIYCVINCTCVCVQLLYRLCNES